MHIEPVIGPGAQLCTSQHAVAKCTDGKMIIFMVNVGEEDIIIPQGSIVARITEQLELN